LIRLSAEKIKHSIHGLPFSEATLSPTLLKNHDFLRNLKIRSGKIMVDYLPMLRRAVGAGRAPPVLLKGKPNVSRTISYSKISLNGITSFH
jgi:hypothetical protein